MSSKLDLKWTDLISPTMTSDEYLEHHGEKIEYNYKTYEVNEDLVKTLKKILVEKNEMLRVLALGADWCPDCSRNIPRMIKIIKHMNENQTVLRILYGIMVNALHKPGEILWHKKRSPPEAVDPKFDLKAIPTFYFFNKEGDNIGIIVEGPKDNSSLEEEMLEIIERNL